MIVLPGGVSGRFATASRFVQAPPRGTVTMQPGESRILLQEYFPEAVLFGGTADHLSGALRVWIEEDTSAAIADRKTKTK
jgi:hypothetical protein